MKLTRLVSDSSTLAFKILLLKFDVQFSSFQPFLAEKKLQESSDLDGKSY